MPIQHGMTFQPLQDKHRGLQAELQSKEGLLGELQSQLQQVQGKLAASEQAAAQAAHTAERQHAAVEERARLAEQVCE